jgi:hypothetical protein
MDTRCASCGEIKEIFSKKDNDGKVYVKIGHDIWLKLSDHDYTLCSACIKKLNIVLQEKDDK